MRLLLAPRLSRSNGTSLKGNRFKHAPDVSRSIRQLKEYMKVDLKQRRKKDSNQRNQPAITWYLDNLRELQLQ